MSNNSNKSTLFAPPKRRADTIQDALDGTIAHLSHGKLQQQIAEVFDDAAFGPEPVVTYQLMIRRDPKEPGSFSYVALTKVSHDLGNQVRLFGLSK